MIIVRQIAAKNVKVLTIKKDSSYKSLKTKNDHALRNKSDHLRCKSYRYFQFVFIFSGIRFHVQQNYKTKQVKIIYCHLFSTLSSMCKHAIAKIKTIVTLPVRQFQTIKVRFEQGYHLIQNTRCWLKYIKIVTIMNFLLILLISFSFDEVTQNIQSKYLLVDLKEEIGKRIYNANI